MRLLILALVNVLFASSSLAQTSLDLVDLATSPKEISSDVDELFEF
jgi:hypothetical protein